MKNMFFILAILIAGIVQVTWFDFFKFFNTKPDFILVILILSFFSLNTKWAVFLAVFSGILKDSLTVNPFGINTVLFLCWFFLVKRIAKEIVVEDNFRRGVLIIGIVFLHNLITGLILVYSGRYIPPGIFLRNLILVLLYTSVILPLVFKFLPIDEN